jgi:hypothetical protein
MRITLRPLSKKELELVLKILNLDRKVRTRELAELEAIGEEFSKRAVAKKIRGTTWRKGDEFPPRALSKQWIDSRESWISVVVSQREQPGWWFGNIPPLGLPAQYPPIIIRDPGDLTYWLLIRGVANGQHLKFVKCARASCGKFGMRLRARAESRYCSSECQLLENANRANARGSRRRHESREPFMPVRVAPRA